LGLLERREGICLIFHILAITWNLRLLDNFRVVFALKNWNPQGNKAVDFVVEYILRYLRDSGMLYWYTKLVLGLTVVVIVAFVKPPCN